MTRGLTLRATGLSVAMLALMAGGSLAEMRSVVIGNSGYAMLPEVAEVDTAPVIGRLTQRGFRVVSGSNLQAEDVRRAIGDLTRPDSKPDQRIVVLEGRFVRSQSETWFLGQDAGPVGIMDAGQVGVPLSLVVELMQDGPNSVLLLGTDATAFPTTEPLQPGIGPVPKGSGVTIISGFPPGIGRAAEVLARQGGTVAEALEQGPSLQLLTGAGADPVVVASGGSQPVVAPPTRPVVVPPSDRVVRPGQAEQSAWDRAKRANTLAAYREFLGKYPSSIYAGAARGRIEDLQPKVVSRVTGPEATEAALNLSRDRRRGIQRQLTLLGYDTRGVDGAFGPATRRAIARFQQDVNAQVSGYLNASQIEVLQRRANERSKQLEAEAERSRSADTLYWQSQRDQGFVGAQRYLSRYPRGVHAETARQIIADAERREGGSSDAAWRRTTDAGTAAAYREFLNNHPRSRYADEARKRLANLERRTAEDEASEAALGLNPQLRSVVEQRLQAEGFKVGKVDGRFDRNTRAAIRNYQASRGLPVSGFLNQATAGRLLSDTLSR